MVQNSASVPFCLDLIESLCGHVIILVRNAFLLIQVYCRPNKIMSIVLNGKHELQRSCSLSLDQNKACLMLNLPCPLVAVLL